MTYTLEEAQAIVDDFNEKHKVGAQVEYEEVINQTGKKKYIVRHPAQVVNMSTGFIVVAWLKGKSGWVSINHITGWVPE